MKTGQGLSAAVDKLFERISENILIKSIRQGLLYIMPLIMVGSFVLMALNLPIEAINTFLNTLFGEHWRTLGLAIHKGTFRIMSLSALVAVSYALTREINKAKRRAVNPVVTVLTALSCYIAFDPATEFVVDESATGPTGMFGAIVIALISTYLFMFFSTRLPQRSRSFAYDSDTILLSSLSNVLPCLLTIAGFALARLLMDALSITALVESMRDNLNGLFLKGGGSLITVIFYDFITHIMWFFGIHGTNVMERFARDIFVSNSDLNIALAAVGEAPTQILTKEFFDIFVFIGGAGCTLGLLIALFVAGRSSNASSIAKYSVWPGIFNINESMVYGLPIIFNPYYIVPFLLTPVALSITSYLAFYTGLVPLTTSRVVWTTPIFLSGYFSTGSVAGVLLQLTNLALSTLIYLPFVRLYEKQLLRSNTRIFKEISQEYSNAQPGNPPRIMRRTDEQGMMVRSLATELRHGLGGADIGLYMEYQPKTRSDGRVYGAEALLRWKHPAYGFVSPLVALGVAEEAGLSRDIGSWVLEQSFAQLGVWQQAGYNIKLSVNLSPEQLQEDAILPRRIAGIIKTHGLNPGCMELELTEHAALDNSDTTRSRLAQVRDMGVSIAIDDFGMGNSSLLYLRDFYANGIKLDISLVRTINDSVQSQEIVRSVVSLSKQLGLSVVAEGTETKEQVEMLAALGCEQFQGWYFSKSLPPEQFEAYLQEHGTADEV